MFKPSRRRAVLRAKPVALAVAVAFLPWGEAFALPTGEQVVHGTVSVTTGGSTMQINHTTPKGIVNWQGFSIDLGETVNVSQAASAVLLNRVVGNDPSRIFGSLNAQGQVFLVNNAGVLFGPNASVSAGSLVASTLSITDQNFINGNYQFYNPGNAGSVVNAGSIVTAGGYTALVGPQVRNDGVIIARSGSVALAAGDRVSLDMIGDGLISVSVDQAALNASVLNNGTIEADGGTVLLSARSTNALLDTVINAGGVIRANSLVERNGEIFLDGGSTGVVNVSGTLQAGGGAIKVHGDKAAILDGARVDVSGETGGGTVSTNATALYVAPGAWITADATQAGDGGRVILWADRSTQVHGSVSARGAAGGAGGFVETSGGFLNITSAPDVGPGGTWLIDPYNLFVVAGSGTANNGGAPLFSPTGTDSEIGADLIAGQLNAGASVMLDTGANGNQEGDIVVNAAIFKGAQNSSSLRFNAADDVFINAPVQLASGDFNVVAGGDMVVRSLANAMGGSIAITLGGDLAVLGTAGAAQLGAQTGQTITARSVEVTAQAGGTATITNGSFVGLPTPPGGNQIFTVTGGAPGTGFTVQTLAGGAAASVTNSAPSEQRILATNADHIKVDGRAGAAGIYAFGGTQTLSITGSGANAIAVGAAGNLGPSQIIGGVQDITAGAGSETGSISVVGADSNATFTGFSSGQILGGTQTVSTSGSLRISGGSAPNQPPFGFATGLFHNGSGEQRVNAANIEMQGGPTGANNLAIIISSGGAGTIAAGDQIINAGGGIELTGGLSGNNNTAIIVSFAEQTVNASDILLQGGAGGSSNSAFMNSTWGAGQLITVAGDIRIAGGPGGSAGMFNGSNSPMTINAPQIISADNVILAGASGGTRNGAFIGSEFGGDQTLTVTGEIRVTGGSGGIRNRAGIVTNANQTINGNPDIVLTGGAGGGAGDGSNNVFIQATGDDTKLQNINAGTVELRSGAGTDASATFNAARQVITTTGDVSLFGGAGPGGLNGVRIGGIGGTTLGPTNLTLTVGGDLLLHGGTANGASLGSSGASTQSNNITVNALAGNVTLESEDAGARIGSSGQVAVAPGNISVTAGGSFQLGNGTAVRANGPITFTANGLTNAGTITNGGGANTGNLILVADTFHLAGGNIQAGAAGVFLRPRTGTNSLGIESAGATTLTNADIASINTSNFVGFGSGIGTNFIGNIAIGENAQVVGGAKNLVFFRSLSAGGTTTIGTHGVTTTGDVIVAAGGGAIVSNGGTVAGDEVQLRAAQGIGAPGARVHTAANALTAGTSGDAFITEANDVTLRTIVLNVGGNTVLNTTNTGTGGVLDLTVGGALNVAGSVSSGGLMNINAAGPLNVTGAGMQDGILSSSGGQTITAQSVSVMAQDGRLAQIVNNVSGGQTITTGALSVNGGSALTYPTLSGVVQNAGDAQTINASSVQVQGTDVGTNNGIFIRAASGDQRLNVTGDISIVAGPGGEAWIQGSPNGQQTIQAHNITMTNGIGGNNSFAALQAGHQEIRASGDVRLTGRATGGTQGGVRLGGLRNAVVVTPTDLELYVNGDVVLTGGSTPNNFAGIGSTGAFGVANDIYIEAGGVSLNSSAASVARIGHGTTPGGGSIEIRADRGIELNGATQPALIQTLGNVTLEAASISQVANGFVRADTLTTNTTGDTSLTGPNQVASFSGISGADLTLTNGQAINVTSLSAGGNATLTNAGAVTLSGSWTSANATITATGFAPTIVESAGGSIETDTLTVNASDGITLGGANHIARLHATTFTGDFVFNNTGPLEVLQVDIDDVTFTNAGAVTVNGLWNSSATSITTTGAGSDLTVNNNFISGVGPMNVNVAGALAVNASSGNAGFQVFGPVAGGQTITAHSINLTAQNSRRANIENFGVGDQSITATDGGMNLHVPTGAGVAQIINNTPGANQTVTVNEHLSILGGVISPTTSRNSGIFKNGGLGLQTVSASGITLQGANTGTMAGAIINSQGDQLINVAGGNINLIGGSGGTSNSATIGASATGQQTILAHDINLSNGVGGTDTVAAIVGGHQLIDVTGNVTLTAQGALVSLGAPALPGVRIGAPGGSTTGTDLTLLVDGNLVLQGGTAANNGVGIGSSGGGVAQQNTIVIDVGGNVILNSGTGANAGARIGSSPQNGLAGGSISITADGAIGLNGTDSTTSIRTLGSVTLEGASISEAANGFILANTLTTRSTGGDTSLTGPNQVSSYNGTSSGDLSLMNTGPLAVTGVDAAGNASLSNALGDVNLVGRWRSATASISSGGALVESGSGFIQTGSLTTFVGLATNLGGANEIAVFGNTRPSDLTLNNTTALHLLDVSAPNNATVTAAGTITIGGRLGANRVELRANGGGIEETAGGSIATGILGTLTTFSTGDTTLNSTANQVTSFNATSGGDVSLVTNGFLTVTGMNAAGDALVTDFGNVTVGGSSWTAGGRSSITAGDIILNTVLTSPEVQVDAGSGRVFETGPGAIVANSLTTRSSSSTQLTGLNQVANYSGTSGADLTLNNSGALTVTDLSAAGPAAVTNFGNVTVSGPWTSSSASINANGFGASISEAGGGFIQAGSLTTFSDGATSLTGANEVQSFNASTGFGGDINLNNTVALNVTGLSAGGNATLTNAGDVNITGLSSSFGSMDIRTTGGDLTLMNSLSSAGAMTLDIGGTLTVSANGPQTAQLNANSGGQTITAQSVEVVAQGGGFASIFNNGGDQRITINGGGTGAGLDVHTLASGGLAQIGQNTPGFTQTIEVTDANHINVNGAGPAPFPGSGAGIFSAGTQTLSITGSGANAITVGSLGARGASGVGGLRQSVTAGLAGEQGSITIVGSDAQQALAGFVTNPVAGGTQGVSTSGTLSVTGGRANPQFGNFPAGIFHNGTGQQTINAASIVLTGGPSGANNAALINVPGGGVPANAGAQVVNVSGDITIAGGPGGNAGILGSASRQQTINAHNISVTNSAGGGNNSVGFIQGGHQQINASGDVRLTARASGGDLPGVRIGGLAGLAPTATDLALNVGGHLVLTGGTAVNNGVGIGSTAAVGAPVLANNITINAGGSVILNSGTLAGTGARIGSPATATGPGNVSITASNAIELNGVEQGTVIRTLGTVTLVADHITEASNGFIVAGALNTTTHGNASLSGPNRIAFFNATSGGDVSLNNTGALNVTGMAAVGDATITNIGDVTVSGPWTAGGTSSITVGSDILVNAAMVSPEVVLVANGGAIIEAPTGSITADTLTTVSSGETRLVGANDVEVFSSTSFGGLAFNNTSGALTLGNIETNGGAFSLGQTGDLNVNRQYVFGGPVSMAVGGSLLVHGGSAAGSAAEIAAHGPIDISTGGNLSVMGGSGEGAFARILGYSDINLTVGGFITLTGSTGNDGWARIQLDSRDSVMRIHFPNLASGGFFVNGIEGLLRDGHTGFLADNGVAAPEQQFITTYGAP